MGIIHGGVMASLIESVCSYATGLAVLREGRVAVGQSLSINLLRPIVEGSIEVEAVAIHRGRTSWVWTARVTDSTGRLCAHGQMTMAVREPPPGTELPKV
jgi:1,4-dihydroxy-2-naphthoyl-CoA hydrolase